MNRITVHLPYGQEEILLQLPCENLIGVYSPNDAPAVDDLDREIFRALENPIASPHLEELVKTARKIMILADDNTRLTPVDKIIPPLLNKLNTAGIADAQISVLIALGTHRAMTPAEILQKFGEEAVRRVKIKNHDFKNPAVLTDLGETENGTRILINKEACEADFVIGIGSIVPHHIPGFSGGAKIVQPGISGECTTAATHLLSVRAARSYLGSEDNPVRRELNKIAATVGMSTVINTVLNRNGEVAGVFFGDVQAAFLEGVRLAKQVYAVAIPREADIVIAGSHPCDLEFWQAHKTLYPADLAVKAGGTLIIVTPCDEGVAVMHGGILELTGYSSEELRQRVAQGRIKDEVAAALAIAWAQIKEREEVAIVSRGIDAAAAKQLGFTPFETVEEALTAALRKQGAAASITVLTHAPDMLPLIQK